MKTSKEFLSSLLKTAQMGQIGIRSVLDTSMEPDLRNALCTQLAEYDAIEAEAHTIAAQRGWELTDVDPALRFLTDRIARFRITGRDPGSKIADMMILGNTKSMIRELQNLHKFTHQDHRVRILCQKLLDCEAAGIQKMHGFL